MYGTFTFYSGLSTLSVVGEIQKELYGVRVGLVQYFRVDFVDSFGG